MDPLSPPEASCKVRRVNVPQHQRASRISSRGSGKQFRAPKVPPKSRCRPRNSYADRRQVQTEIPSQVQLQAPG